MRGGGAGGERTGQRGAMITRPERSDTRPPFEKGTTRALLLIGAAAVLLSAIWWLQGRPQAQSVPLRSAPAEAALTPSPATGAGLAVAAPDASADPPAVARPSGQAGVLIDVRGDVRKPGLYELPAGSRVMDAIEIAGGLPTGSRYGAVNLARVLVDGEQVRIGGGPHDQVPPAADATVPVAAVDLNSATEVELETLDGVGPVLAGAIVQWRTENGPFQSVEDLLDVSGIGEATLAGLRDQVTVG